MTTKREAEKLFDEQTVDEIVELLEDKVGKMIEEYMDHMKEDGSKLKEKVQRPIHDAMEVTERTVCENPLKTIGATFLSGLVIGWLLRK